MLKSIIVILIAVAMVFFVMVPLAYMAMGRIANPFSFDLGGIASKNISNVRNGGASVSNLETTCATPAKSLLPHTRDAILSRDGEESTIKSKVYDLEINLDVPVVDWQYTEGKLDNELASFVYKDVIVNILARKSNALCSVLAKNKFNTFHTEGKGVEYFSSRAYLNLGKPIGLARAVFRTHGEREVDGNQFYWYIVDETFSLGTNSANIKNSAQTELVTIWYTTHIGRNEYWFAFRTLKEDEDNLNKTAIEFIEQTAFLKF